MKKSDPRLWLLASSLSGCILLVGLSASADKIWLTPTDGLLQVGTNWSAGAGMFVNIYGGNATFDSGSITVGDTNVAVRVGRSSSATLTINGGAMQTGGQMILGESGFNNSQGTLRMTGGQLTLGSFLSLGESLSGSTRIVFMTGGQLVVTNSGTNGFVRVGN